MELRTVIEPCSLGQTFTFIPMGDFHLGSANCDTKALDRWIRRIADDPDARWVGMGDLLESIAPDDPRWNPGDIDDASNYQDTAESRMEITLRRTQYIGDWYVDRLTEILRPIIGKCWSLNDGNHEDKFNAKYFTCLLDRVRRNLGQPADLYAGWASGTRVVFEDKHGHRRPLKVFQQHGYQAGRKDGAKINGLDDLIAFQEGYDIYLVAHSHSRLLKTHTALGTNNEFNDLVDHEVFGGHTASFLRTYQLHRVGYGEKKGYPPVSIKPIRFAVTPRKSGLEIEGIL